MKQRDWEKKDELEKIMLDYVKWIFNLDFCTPMYIIMSELVMDKLKERGWNLRTRRYEKKIKSGNIGNLVREYQEEK